MKKISTKTKTAKAAIRKHAKATITKRRAYLEEKAKDEKHGQRWIDNRMKKTVKALQEIEAAEDIESINITVEWKKSRTWGANPTATARIRMTDGTFFTGSGHASGCGYDKESAAVAESLNACPAIRRLLIVANSRPKSRVYGYIVNEHSAAFSKGVGVSCFRPLFESLGYKWERAGFGKTFDVYTIN